MSFLCHAVCLLTVNSGRLRSTAWKVASADSSTLKVAALKREHSVPPTTVSPLTGARCYSLTPPCVKANSEALFKKQLLRRCTISWNDPLTFLPLLICKQWIIRSTRVGCTAPFFRSEEPAPQISAHPKGVSFLEWACSKPGELALQHLLLITWWSKERGRLMTEDGWGKTEGVKGVPAHTSAAQRTSSAQPGPEPKILFNWMICCCLFNNLLL